jgi:hypothetical protein
VQYSLGVLKFDKSKRMSEMSTQSDIKRLREEKKDISERMIVISVVLIQSIDNMNLNAQYEP